MSANERGGVRRAGAIVSRNVADGGRSRRGAPPGAAPRHMAPHGATVSEEKLERTNPGNGYTSLGAGTAARGKIATATRRPGAPRGATSTSALSFAHPASA